MTEEFKKGDFLLCGGCKKSLNFRVIVRDPEKRNAEVVCAKCGHVLVLVIAKKANEVE